MPDIRGLSLEVYVASLPFNRLADRILSQGGSSGRKEEGSLLGNLARYY